MKCRVVIKDASSETPVTSWIIPNYPVDNLVKELMSDDAVKDIKILDDKEQTIEWCCLQGIGTWMHYKYNLMPNGVWETIQLS